MDRVPFLRARAADARAQLTWLNGELAALRQVSPARAPLFERLTEELAIARARLSDLDTLISAAYPTLMSRAMETMHLLDARLSKVGVSYLAALQKEGDAEKAVRGILFAAAQTAGTTWIRDVVVRLDGPHAVFVAFPEFPVVTAPPRHAVSLYDMPGLYHELGHVAFRRYPAISDDLRATVDRHFAAASNAAGPLSPAARVSREQHLADARETWTTERLAEVFCDAFATYVCGPAHYISLVDLGFGDVRDPHTSKVGHPPDSARERVCFETLTLPQRREAVVQLAHRTWLAHLNGRHPGHQYRLSCPDTLLRELVGASLAAIVRDLPEAVRYNTPLPHPADLDATPGGLRLEEIFNRAAALLLLAPDRYHRWEPWAMETCRLIGAEAARRREIAHMAS